MTLALYARRKQWPLEGVEVRRRLDLIEREIGLRGGLDAEQRARLLEIADRCPVHRTLVSEIVIRSRLV